ncbi:hypothetical protein [Kitasatospora sp. NPDC093558]|uniref:hypothetical protein n=1 Tax=Kitasatospora sp. NPDC093558 TaxID=3155201 RepID=UPI00344580F2
MAGEVVLNEAGALLRTRAATLIRETVAAIDALDEIEPEALRARVQVRLVADLEGRLREVRKLVDGQADVPLDRAWSDLSYHRVRLNDLFEETLALMEGAALRRSWQDGGCRLADRLADEISVLTPEKWNAFTVLDTEEFYAGSTRVIRVRFPGDGFWDLPIVAHEFGHFAGPKIIDIEDESVHPLAEKLKEVGEETPAHWPWLHESFADIFATYAVGPAYGLVCALDRFDPAAADQDNDTHPAPNTRLALILGTLAVCDDGQNYGRVMEKIRAVWAVQTGEAGSEGKIELREPFDQWLDFSLRLLRDRLPSAMYKGWVRTADLSRLLGGDARAEATDWSLRDIVNAAWRARIRENGDAPGWIAQRACALAESRLLEVRHVRAPR